MGSALARTTATRGLARLVDRASGVLVGRDGLMGPTASALLSPVLADALAEPELLPEAVLGHRPPSGFGKHLLFSGPRFTLFSTITAPGQSLAVHDHGSSGVVGVYRGIEEEIRYEPTSESPGSTASPLLTEIGRSVHYPGEVMAVRPPPADIHAVGNPGTEWSLCVHLFAVDPLAQGFNLYLPPQWAPQATGPLTYDFSAANA